MPVVGTDKGASTSDDGGRFDGRASFVAPKQVQRVRKRIGCNTGEGGIPSENGPSGGVELAGTATNGQQQCATGKQSDHAQIITRQRAICNKNNTYTYYFVGSSDQRT